MTGTFRCPRLTIAWSAGKIFLWARSPVAPKKTSASDDVGVKVVIQSATGMPGKPAPAALGSLGHVAPKRHNWGVAHARGRVNNARLTAALSVSRRPPAATRSKGRV